MKTALTAGNSTPSDPKAQAMARRERPASMRMAVSPDRTRVAFPEEPENVREIDQQHHRQRQQPVQQDFCLLVADFHRLHVVAFFLIAPGCGQKGGVGDGTAESPVDYVISDRQRGGGDQIHVGTDHGFRPQKQLIDSEKKNEIQRQQQQRAQFTFVFQGKYPFRKG